MNKQDLIDAIELIGKGIDLLQSGLDIPDMNIHYQYCSALEDTLSELEDLLTDFTMGNEA